MTSLTKAGALIASSVIALLVVLDNASQEYDCNIDYGRNCIIQDAMKTYGMAACILGLVDSVFWLTQSVMRCALSDKYAPLDEEELLGDMA